MIANQAIPIPTKRYLMFQENHPDVCCRRGRQQVRWGRMLWSSLCILPQPRGGQSASGWAVHMPQVCVLGTPSRRPILPQSMV
ncbi:hypothetical protein GQ457_01G026650 [Hibiscus cannabinus]